MRACEQAIQTMGDWGYIKDLPAGLEPATPSFRYLAWPRPARAGGIPVCCSGDTRAAGRPR